MKVKIMSREKDYIGFDPAAWIERLRDVNATSQFAPEAKRVIEDQLRNLQMTLARMCS